MKISDLPYGASPKALNYSHFPAPWLAVVWRNWNRVHPAKIAEVLETTEQEIVSAAEKMGLVRNDSALAAYKERGFLTILRYNWQLLDYPQLLQLLDWTPEQMENVLLNEDFMFIKLSCQKPRCGTVRRQPLTDEQELQLRQIRQWMQETDALLPEENLRETPFNFAPHIGKRVFTAPPTQDHLKMIYPWFGGCGEIFLSGAPDPLPEELLRDYASCGINAVWIPAVLYQLVPWLGKDMPLSARWEERLANLRKMAVKTAKYGIGLYLYLNEPRGIPGRVKIEHEEWRGVLHRDTGCYSFCPWAPGMLDALGDGIEQLCRAVPELGGIYTINQSENITHCLSRTPDRMTDEQGNPLHPETDTHCPVCFKHSIPENICAVLTAMHDGIRRSGTAVRQLAYTWAWSKEWECELADRLPEDITLMTVSETNVKTDCFGAQGVVIDYSISKPGPGPDAEKLWKHAAKTGRRTAAKIQANTTWEMGGVPVIPVPTLVEEHLNKIRACGVQDFMVSWTLGGYPGGNLELLDHSAEELAHRDFGEFSPQIMEIYKAFGEAFRKLPFDGAWQIYFSPQNVGPANLLYPEKTNMPAGMVCGIPYDDLKMWCGNYSPEIMERAFTVISEEWGRALENLRTLGKKLPEKYRAAFEELWPRAEATYCCLRSTALQIKFIRLRDTGKMGETLPLIEEEIELAKRLLAVILTDSRIGFEAANHYFYGENELREKIIACEFLKAAVR